TVTRAARDDRIDDNTLARGEPPDVGPDGLHDAGRFVADHPGVEHARMLAGVDGEIRVAHRRRRHAHHDVSALGHRHRAIDQREAMRSLEECGAARESHCALAYRRLWTLIRASREMGRNRRGPPRPLRCWSIT